MALASFCSAQIAELNLVDVPDKRRKRDAKGQQQLKDRDFTFGELGANPRRPPTLWYFR